MSHVKLSTHGLLSSLIKSRYDWMKKISENSRKICDGTGTNLVADFIK